MTYAVIDITSLVAGAVHRAMKLYSKPSLDSWGLGEGNPFYASSSYCLGWASPGRENVDDIQALSHQAGAWTTMEKP